MRFEWDARKASANVARHGVFFLDAATVFNDERAITIADADGPEERYVMVGMDAIGRVLVVVYTWRGEAVRIISARRATRSERLNYARGGR